MSNLFDAAIFDSAIYDTDEDADPIPEPVGVITARQALLNARIRVRTRRGHYGDYGTKTPANWSE